MSTNKEVKMNINLLKTTLTRLFGLYSQFKSIVSDLETNNTLDNREWAGELLNNLATELYYEANCLTDVLFPPKIKEKDETMFKIDGIINAERNPMSEDEFCELFLKWAEDNKLQFGGGLGVYREEEEDELLAGK
jgi:hypothetical protein